MIGDLFSDFFRKNLNFSILFVRFVLSIFFPEIGRAETNRFVQKSSISELPARFFGRLKIFFGSGSI